MFIKHSNILILNVVFACGPHAALHWSVKKKNEKLKTNLYLTSFNNKEQQCIAKLIKNYTDLLILISASNVDLQTKMPVQN